MDGLVTVVALTVARANLRNPTGIVTAHVARSIVSIGEDSWDC